MTWTDEKKEALRMLWNEGHPTAEIGRRIEMSKNAVVGQAHRMGLDRRPSPILERSADMARRAARAPRITLPKLPSVVVDLFTVKPMTRKPQTAPPPVAPAPPISATRTCQWIGGDRPYVFCGKPALLGKNWCPGHYKRVYVRRAEAVAA